MDLTISLLEYSVNLGVCYQERNYNENSVSIETPRMTHVCKDGANSRQRGQKKRESIESINQVGRHDYQFQ